MAQTSDAKVLEEKLARALSELDRLREENAALRGRFVRPEGSEGPRAPTSHADPRSSSLDTKAKVALFRSLFAGRADVYPLVTMSGAAGDDAKPYQVKAVAEAIKESQS